MQKTTVKASRLGALDENYEVNNPAPLIARTGPFEIMGKETAGQGTILEVTEKEDLLTGMKPLVQRVTSEFHYF
jgi:hypothetical protein